MIIRAALQNRFERHALADTPRALRAIRNIAVALAAAAVSLAAASAGSFPVTAAHAQAWVNLTPGSGDAPAARAWSFDLTTNMWTQLAPVGGPPNVRYGVAAVYDPAAGELVTFAGFTSMGRFDDTWRLDPAAQTWTDVSPATSPLERCLHAACDDANRRVTVFGGTTNSGMTNELWGFDLWTQAWTPLFPSGTAPSAREGAAAVYDGAADRMVFFGGNDGGFLNEVWSVEGLSNTVTSTGGRAAPALTLEQNVPNPFNPSTVIAWTLNRSGPVALRVFGIRGEVVRTLVSGEAGAGEYSAVWDGRDDRGRRVASGVYFYRLETPDAVRSRSMVLLK